ncbi:MAG TPA: serine/threonine-protein kinase [Labilithrix sp.]
MSGGLSELEERKRALTRFMAMSTIAWTSFFLTDLLAVRGLGAPLEYLAAMRFAGTGIGFAAYAVARSRGATLRTLDLVEAIVFPAASLLVSFSAIPVGGITSPLALGVAMVTLARAIVPAPWRRALPIALASALTFPAAMAFASRGPAVAAQLASPAAWTFGLTSLFLVLGAFVAAAGSHLQWSARRQLREARRLGAYRLVTRIGSGGMGEVWLAQQMPLDRPVALKLLKKRVLTEDAGAVRRFRREALAASRLSHPNTIRVFDYGASDDGVLYIVMELLDGLDLEALIARIGRLPPERVVHLARQTCASLAEAHAQGIVHCDVKPANVFVAHVGDDHDFVKVLDFGLARVLAGPGATTVATGIRGTPAFMAPEVVRGERPGPDSDVYAMGALLYYMLTATTVFEAGNVTHLITAHLEQQPVLPSKRLGAPLPTDLEAAIMRCLAKDRAARFANAKELEEALAACSVANAWTADDARAAWELVRPSLTLKRT